MLKTLLRKRKPPPPAPRVPPGVRVYAIGDIHGRDDLFADILRRIDEDDARRTPMRRITVLLGDLVDRGSESAAVVDRAIALAAGQADVRLLKGNHEEIMLLACQGKRDALRLFDRIGGRETAFSYGIDPARHRDADFDGLSDLLRAAVPEAHRDFLAAMEDVVEIGDYVFVHAGIRPGVALADQRKSDLRWIRDEFLEHRDFHAKFVVHGHTITEGIDERPNRLGIDTGAFASNILTAVGLEDDRRWFLSTDPMAS